MALIARLALKPNAPFHAYGRYSTFGELHESSEEEKADWIDSKRTEIESRIDGLDVKVALIYGIVQNPLVPGNSTAGFESVELELIDTAITTESFDRGSEIWNRFRDVVFQVTNRLISFMKYEKGNPFLRDAQIGDFVRWEWWNDAGQLLYTEPKGIVLAHFPGAHGSLDSKGLRKSDLPKLHQYLQEEHDVNVVDDLLMQAKEAVFEENLLLAVLLLAISVEVKVKTSFLGGDSVASDAFDYSQEKGKIAISPVEFIDKIAETAFGESFKKVDPTAFACIEYLFRCRNKIAHRGVGKYRDTKGVEKVVDEETVKSWWNAVKVLFLWISAKTS